MPTGESVTLAGFRVAAGPLGDTVAVRLTVPAKLLTLATVMVDMLDEARMTLRESGLELTVNP